MIEHVGLHPFEQTDIVGDVAKIRQAFADIRPALPRFRESPPRAEQLGVRPNEGEAPPRRERRRHRLPIEPLQRRLRIEEFEMARPPRHEQEDDRFRLGGMVARARPQRIGVLSAALVQERRERHGAEAQGASGQKPAAGCGIVMVHDVLASLIVFSGELDTFVNVHGFEPTLDGINLDDRLHSFMNGAIPRAILFAIIWSIPGRFWLIRM